MIKDIPKKIPPSKPVTMREGYALSIKEQMQKKERCVIESVEELSKRGFV